MDGSLFGFMNADQEFQILLIETLKNIASYIIVILANFVANPLSVKNELLKALQQYKGNEDLLLYAQNKFAQLEQPLKWCSQTEYLVSAGQFGGKIRFIV